ncbi:hypothetical protein NC652_038910 [Populus alba x Populus x berolinensis]|nr:hypothetical protein NC652_038910 [Populus alba x Populus x berolinensis]
MEVSDFEEETLKKRHKKNPFTPSMGEVNFMHEDDDNDRLETARARFSNVIKRHTALAERLSRDSDKMIFERGLFRMVHMEVDRKAMLAETHNDTQNIMLKEKITYRVGKYGDPCELYQLVLESKSFLEKMTVP